MDANWRFKLEPETTLTDAIQIVNWRWKTDNKKGSEITNAERNIDTSEPGWHDSKSGDKNMNGAPTSNWFEY